MERLLLARVLFRQAEQLIGHVNPALQSLALLPLQDAVELVLRAVADHLRAKQEVAFEKTMENVAATAGRPLPLQDRMAALNKARVSLKHYGTPTERAAVSRFAPEALTFAREIVRDHLGMDFDSISLADLILHPKVRRQVKIAEQDLSTGQFEACAKACAIGFAYLTERLAEDPRWSRRSRTSRIGSRGYDRAKSDLYDLADAMRTATQQLDRHSHLFALLASGIGLENYWHFAALTPRVTIMGDGKPLVGGSRSPTPKQAQFCLDYLRDTALRSQNSRGGVFANYATSLRVTGECDLLGCLPHEGEQAEADVVARAQPHEIFVHEGAPKLEKGKWLRVVQLTTAAVLWIDSGMLEVVTSPRHLANTADLCRFQKF